MLASFYLAQSAEIIEKHWLEKNLLASGILGTSAHRKLRPELIGDRSRLDLMWFEGKLGIRGPRLGGDFEFEFHELLKPDTVQEGILELMADFRNDPLPESLAQVRFRFHPEIKNRGLWLDISNESIKNLLEEESWLKRQLKKGLKIEMGQKGKEVVLGPDESLDFVEARPMEWLDSYSFENEPVTLKSKIAHFSQPGPEANRNLIAAAYDLLDSFSVKARNFVEFGAGYGNLTVAFNSSIRGKSWSSELDRDMATTLLQNQQEFFPNVEVTQAKADPTVIDLQKFELCIIDPPRPGFADFFAGLRKFNGKLPRYFLCCHCHSRGLLGDSTALKNLSYKLLGWSSVDIFPATQHHEVLSLWELSL